MQGLGWWKTCKRKGRKKRKEKRKGRKRSKLKVRTKGKEEKMTEKEGKAVSGKLEGGDERER